MGGIYMSLCLLKSHKLNYNDKKSLEGPKIATLGNLKLYQDWLLVQK